MGISIMDRECNHKTFFVSSCLVCNPDHIKYGSWNGVYKVGNQNISMSTNGRRSGIHFCVTGVQYKPKEIDGKLHGMIDIHLTRDQCQALIDEINLRLF